MKTLHLTIPGTPTSKGRPRISARGGFARAFTPSKTRAAEATLAARALALLELRADRASWPSSTALEVSFTFTLPVPASWPAWKREAALAGKHRPAGKPDVDNLAKLAKDALNEVLWLDDSQVVYLTARKVYGVEPTTAIVVVEVEHQTVRVTP